MIYHTKNFSANCIRWRFALGSPIFWTIYPAISVAILFIGWLSFSHFLIRKFFYTFRCKGSVKPMELFFQFFLSWQICLAFSHLNILFSTVSLTISIISLLVRFLSLASYTLQYFLIYFICSIILIIGYIFIFSLFSYFVHYYFFF